MKATGLSDGAEHLFELLFHALYVGSVFIASIAIQIAIKQGRGEAQGVVEQRCRHLQSSSYLPQVMDNIYIVVVLLPNHLLVRLHLRLTHHHIHLRFLIFLHLRLT